MTTPQDFLPTFDTPEEMELAKLLSGILSNYSSAFVLFNRSLVCINTNNEYIAIGQNFCNMTNEDYQYPIKEPKCFSIVIHGNSFCSLLFPVTGRDKDVKMYICWILDNDMVMNIWAKSEVSSKIETELTVIEKLARNLGDLLDVRIKKPLIEKQCFSIMPDLQKARNEIVDIGADVEKIIYYLKLYLPSRKFEIIDAADLVKRVVDRCNTKIADCGRGIDYDFDNVDLLINANSQMAIASLVNAFQNALLYSPKDSRPLIVVWKEKSVGKEYIIFKLTNDSIVPEDYMKLSSLYQKTGLGISIINGFAKECGGDFDMRYEGNKAVMLLRIPAATPPDDRFYSSNFEFFNRGVPDLLELAMAQVVNFFGGDQHTVTEKSK